MLENKEPLVSIIVPVYNAEKYLNQCIDSLINQTYKNIEIILVNDGSTDGSGIICEQYTYKDHRIKVVNQINSGLSAARNKGITISNGYFISFLDSDDWLELEAIEVSVKDIINFDCELIMWQMIKEYESESVKVIGPFGKDMLFTDYSMKDLYRRAFGPIGSELRKPQMIDSFLSAWGKVYRSVIIKNNNLKFVDTKIIGSEDILFNIQYFNHCKKVKYLHKHLIHYRKTETSSITKSHGSTLYPRFLKLYDYLFAEIRNKKLDDSFSIALNNRIAISMINIGLSEISPRNLISTKTKIKNIKKYLNHPTFVDAYSKLEFKYFPVHWAVFFILCKKRNALGVFLLLKSMRVFIKK